MNDTDTASSTITGWLTEYSPAFILGLAIGFFLKKTFKTFLLFLGAAAVIVILLNHNGWIDIGLDSMTSVAEQGQEKLQSVFELAKEHLGSIGAHGVTGVAGLMLGLKMG
jgi:uncharacterized membrane protein (Fun14 family)